VPSLQFLNADAATWLFLVGSALLAALQGANLAVSIMAAGAEGGAETRVFEVNAPRQVLVAAAEGCDGGRLVDVNTDSSSSSSTGSSSPCSSTGSLAAHSVAVANFRTEAFACLGALLFLVCKKGCNIEDRGSSGGPERIADIWPKNVFL
jgi:hypothetical protein